VIVDERYNGGGKVADIFIDIMKRPLYGFVNNPVGDRRPWSSPEAGIWDAAGAGEAAVNARS
jgi:tricorn protease